MVRMAFVSGTRNILVEDSVFERGHGCSIGSVGAGCVENVVFRNITMRSQLCGCRVKSYSGSGPGHVKNVSWVDITMTNTSSCLQVDANYHPAPPHAKYFVNVSDLLFKNVQGTGCGEPPEFSCPSQAPCTGIVLDDVQLGGKSRDFKMKCENAHGKATYNTVPQSCLSSF